MVAAVKAKTFAVHLLDGVTGSGKTETYFEAVAEAIRSAACCCFAMVRARRRSASAWR